MELVLEMEPLAQFLIVGAISAVSWTAAWAVKAVRRERVSQDSPISATLPNAQKTSASTHVRNTPTPATAAKTAKPNDGDAWIMRNELSSEGASTPEKEPISAQCDQRPRREVYSRHVCMGMRSTKIRQATLRAAAIPLSSDTDDELFTPKNASFPGSSLDAYAKVPCPAPKREVEMTLTHANSMRIAPCLNSPEAATALPPCKSACRPTICPLLSTPALTSGPSGHHAMRESTCLAKEVPLETAKLDFSRQGTTSTLPSEGISRTNTASSKWDLPTASSSRFRATSGFSIQTAFSQELSTHSDVTCTPSIHMTAGTAAPAPTPTSFVHVAKAPEFTVEDRILQTIDRIDALIKVELPSDELPQSILDQSSEISGPTADLDVDTDDGIDFAVDSDVTDAMLHEVSEASLDISVMRDVDLDSSADWSPVDAEEPESTDARSIITDVPAESDFWEHKSMSGVSGIYRRVSEREMETVVQAPTGEKRSLADSTMIQFAGHTVTVSVAEESSPSYSVIPPSFKSVRISRADIEKNFDNFSIVTDESSPTYSAMPASLYSARISQGEEEHMSDSISVADESSPTYSVIPPSFKSARIIHVNTDKILDSNSIAADENSPKYTVSLPPVERAHTLQIETTTPSSTSSVAYIVKSPCARRSAVLNAPSEYNAWNALLNDRIHDGMSFDWGDQNGFLDCTQVQQERKQNASKQAQWNQTGERDQSEWNPMGWGCEPTKVAQQYPWMNPHKVPVYVKNMGMVFDQNVADEAYRRDPSLVRPSQPISESSAKTEKDEQHASFRQDPDIIRGYWEGGLYYSLD